MMIRYKREGEGGHTTGIADGVLPRTLQQVTDSMMMSKDPVGLVVYCCHQKKPSMLADYVTITKMKP